MKHIDGHFLDHLVRDVADPVHRILVAGESLGLLLQILVLHLEAPFLHQGAAHELPFEVLGEGREILLDILGGDLAFIGLDQPALEEGLGELHIRLLDEVVADIFGQAPLGLVLILGAKAVGDLLVQFLVGLLLFLLLVVFLEVLDHRSLVLGRDGDGVGRDGVAILHVHGDHRGESEVEDEGEIIAVFPNVLRLLLRRKRLAQDAEIVVRDMLVEGCPDYLVDGLDERLLAINPLNQRGGDHSLPEAFELRRTTALGEFLFLNFSIILRSDCQGQFKVQVVNFVFSNFHMCFYFDFCLG